MFKVLKNYFQLLTCSVLIFLTCSAATVVSYTNSDNDTCPDLVIESIKIVKQTKSKAFIQYTIKNQGESPANLNGKTKKEYDNVAFKLFLSSDGKMDRGDIAVGGSFIDISEQYPDGLLPANETFTGEFKVGIKQKTSFTPMLVLNLDGWQTLIECDETNNIGAIKL